MRKRDVGRKHKLTIGWRVATFVSVTWLNCSGAVEIHDLSMEVSVGPARYGDLNSDVPACISKFSYTGGHEPNS